MTPLQKQALFTLWQALALCDEAGIEIFAIPMTDCVFLQRKGPVSNLGKLNCVDIDEFEEVLADD